MRTTTLLSLLLLLAATLLLAGCSFKGTKTRTPDEWKTDFGAELAPHMGELRACYEKSNPPKGTKIDIYVQFSSDPSIEPIFVEHGVDDAMQNQQGDMMRMNKWWMDLQACVWDLFEKIPHVPEDTAQGRGHWTIHYDPNVPESASTPLVGAAPAASPPAPAH